MLRALLPALALAPLAGCAGLRPRADGASARQGCGPATFPARLPAAEQVMDTAALLAPLRRDAAWQNPGASAVLSVTYTTSGEPGFPVLVSTTLPAVGKQEPGAGVALHVKESLRALAPNDSTWGVRIRLSGAPARFALERQLLCQPRAMSVYTGYVLVGRVSQGITIAERPASVTVEEQPAPLSRPIPLHVLVDRDGSVAQVDVPLSAELPGLQVRTAIERVAQNVRFYPALRDGAPEQAWATLYAWLSATR